jgi:hypothetical protein
MAWHLARALETLRAQVNAKYPTRSKESDGTKGDPAHASRKSDHNPDSKGVVRALDLTHDPKDGFDSYAFADMLLKRQDPRISYIISNKRIGSGPIGSGPEGTPPGVWRKYTGINPHNHHCHISVVDDARGDDPRLWDIDMGDAPAVDKDVKPYESPPPTLRKGNRGAQVIAMQTRLNFHGARLNADGDFGPVTFAALKSFQGAVGLVADGICGPMSWVALLK